LLELSFEQKNEIEIKRLSTGCYERAPLKYMYCYPLAENNGCVAHNISAKHAFSHGNPDFAPDISNYGSYAM